MINEGVSVLMIVNLDSDSGGACLKKAAAAGIKSIDYDRLTLGGGASYYVSFDNVEVGKLQGEGLQKCLDTAGKTKANIVYIDGDPTDNNAALFKSGYVAALKPKIDSGDYKLVGDQSGFWDATKAGNAFQQLYTQNKGKIDGVVSANDTMAGGIIARLTQDGVAGKVPVTGQDASVGGLQQVLAGNQCMTVYKNTNLEAQAAVEAGDRPDQGRHGCGRRSGHRVGHGHQDEPGGQVRARDPGRDHQGQHRAAVQGRLREGIDGLRRQVRGSLHQVRRFLGRGGGRPGHPAGPHLPPSAWTSGDGILARATSEPVEAVDDDKHRAGSQAQHRERDPAPVPSWSQQELRRRPRPARRGPRRLAGQGHRTGR